VRYPASLKGHSHAAQRGIKQRNRNGSDYSSNGALLLSLDTTYSVMIQRRAALCGAVLRRAAPMERRQELLCCAV